MSGAVGAAAVAAVVAGGAVGWLGSSPNAVGSAAPSRSTAQAQLEAASARWAAAGVEDSSMDVRIGCWECPEAGAWHVEVSHGTVLRAAHHRIGTDSVVRGSTSSGDAGSLVTAQGPARRIDADSVNSAPSVDGLFAQIDHLLAGGAESGGGDVVDAPTVDGLLSQIGRIINAGAAAVTYDLVLGYPVTVELVPAGAPTAHRTISMTNFTRLPTP